MTTNDIVKEFFTETEWDMIYEFIGRALDNDDYDPEQVYTIRSKIHTIYSCDTLRTGTRGLAFS